MEVYNASKPVAAGELVMADAGQAETMDAATRQGRDRVLGVVTTAPAILFEEERQVIGAGTNYSSSPRKPVVALVGCVPTNVSLENGEIKPGDPITVSSTEGVGMKATTAGKVVGTTLEPYNQSSDDSKIMVFVNPHRYVLPGTIQELRMENQRQGVRIKKLQQNQRLKAAVCDVNANATACT